MLIAIGIKRDKQQHVLLVELAKRAPATSCMDVLVMYTQRDLHGVKFVMSDNHAA